MALATFIEGIPSPEKRWNPWENSFEMRLAVRNRLALERIQSVENPGTKKDGIAQSYAILFEN